MLLATGVLCVSWPFVSDARGLQTAKAQAPEGSFRSCHQTKKSAIQRQVPVRLFVEKGLSVEDAYTDMSRLRRYFAEYALTFRVESQITVEKGASIEVTQANLVAQQQKLAGEQRSKNPVQAKPQSDLLALDRSVFELAMKPFERFLHTHDQPNVPVLNIVFQRTIVSQNSVLHRYFRSMNGLTLSPWHQESESDAFPFGRLQTLVDHNPTVFIVHESQRSHRPGDFDALLAHEVGHAFGLSHVMDGKNLMSQSRKPRCVPVLTENQSRTLLRNMDKLSTVTLPLDQSH